MFKQYVIKSQGASLCNVKKEGYGMKSVDIAMIPAPVYDMAMVMEQVKIAGRLESSCVVC